MAVLARSTCQCLLSEFVSATNLKTVYYVNGFRRAFQMCVHAATFNANHASAMTGCLHGTVDPRSCQNVDAPIQAGAGEPHGARVVALCPPCMGSSCRHTYNSPRDNRAVARVQQLLRPRDWAGPAGPTPLAARAARVRSLCYK